MTHRLPGPATALWRVVGPGHAPMPPVYLMTERGARTAAALRNARGGRPRGPAAIVEHRDSPAAPWHPCPRGETIPSSGGADAARHLADAITAHADRAPLPGHVDPRPPVEEDTHP